jgi:hypothetical protein
MNATINSSKNGISHTLPAIMPRQVVAEIRLQAIMLRFMHKKSKKKLIRWRASLIGKTLARYIDHTLAPDAETAEEQLAEAHDIGSPLFERIHEDRLATVFGDQTDPMTTRVSTAKQGMNPAIIPL